MSTWLFEPCAFIGNAVLAGEDGGPDQAADARAGADAVARSRDGTDAMSMGTNAISSGIHSGWWSTPTAASRDTSASPATRTRA